MTLVPCYKRVKQVDNHQEEQEKVLEENDEDGGWVDTHHYAGRLHGRIADTCILKDSRYLNEET